MFKLLDRLKKGYGKTSGRESVIPSEDLLDIKEEETNQWINTSLSFPPHADINSEERYFFQFLHNSLSDMKENQISIAGVDLTKTEDHLLITAFVRNSLNKKVKLPTAPLLLLDPEGNRIIRKEFNLSLLGEIPPRSSRPWQFKFPLKDLEMEEFPHSGWKLSFELSPRTPHLLDLEESWKNGLTADKITKLEKMVQALDIPKRGEIECVGINIEFSQEGQLHTTILIRNGSEKSIKIQQLPIAVEDASGSLIAKGAFNLNNMQVKENTSKPWTFIFPESLILEKSPDLSKWKAYVIQK
ncbi:accessory Sec system S-layer assembly protein [Rossellomorea sp. KS-H15a]|uniref:accessory Sec system S-layer assembly protein n=1 Tax=Rossellomorea sp. KS-H15a TaxID=2963940 RepID=UPI0020C68EF0|nr:accessory Sec system S-layer assembly protein [Rossellomorea sp. KS-H15a]UTE77357.1 accessory Sec system S-layer assembly protein [Rossellomorea sp. KS-H15a]